MYTSKNSRIMYALLLLCAAACILHTGDCLPSIAQFGKRFDSMSGFDYIQICLNNCAQCKKTYGEYFHGQNCAESCLKFSGRAMPNCDDMGGITAFINNLQ